MEIMYEVGDKVIITNTSGVYNFVTGDVVKVIGVDDSAFSNKNAPYLITDGEDSEWIYDYNIEPATVSLLCKWNETELNKYSDSMLEEDNKKCIEFLLKNPGEYFSSEEICKNANISFTSLKTLERNLVRQSELPFWKREKLGYKVSYKLKPNKKKYYGDDGSILMRGKSEHYFNAVKKVKEVYSYDEEEEREEDE